MKSHRWSCYGVIDLVRCSPEQWSLADQLKSGCGTGGAKPRGPHPINFSFPKGPALIKLGVSVLHQETRAGCQLHKAGELLPSSQGLGVWSQWEQWKDALGWCSSSIHTVTPFQISPFRCVHSFLTLSYCLWPCAFQPGLVTQRSYTDQTHKAHSIPTSEGTEFTISIPWWDHNIKATHHL